MKQINKIICSICIALMLVSCTTEIKNNNATIDIEAGTSMTSAEVAQADSNIEVTTKAAVKVSKEDELIGFWVGYFENADTKNTYEKTIYADEGYSWNRENKINISIDEIKDSLVTGHSVVAGNNRPFHGKLQKESDGSYSFQVKEPGDDRYDGEFVFEIADSALTGRWTAYKDIDIKKRKYTLQKRNYSYDANIMLDHAKEYIDWTNVFEQKETYEMEEDIFDEWIRKEFASATPLIYKLNASNRLLSKEEVENLRKGDITIIRNTIYARHGYSFKNRPLRVFFDAQEWYIPVHTNIKNDFTEIEKQNIQLLLKYEKNAIEYYDYFGRG